MRKEQILFAISGQLGFLADKTIARLNARAYIQSPKFWNEFNTRVVRFGWIDFNAVLEQLKESQNAE